MVSEEAAFIAALTADPFDRTARLVYADWLCERERYSDEVFQRLLADGYTAIRAFNLVPYIFHSWSNYTVLPTDHGFIDRSELPQDWYEIVFENSDVSDRNATLPTPKSWVSHASKCVAYERAARAFAELPPERRAELLAGAGA